MYDAIVVGARCAGAATAMLLARRGHKVLLIDRDAFPSDMHASTHMVWHSGTAQLKQWGLLDKVAATGCPPMDTFNFDIGAFVLRGQPPPVDDVTYCYAPRRHALDTLLVESAVKAGAQLRRAKVTEPFFDGDRVRGVRSTGGRKSSVDETARVVIGADGSNSTIARAVGARSYNVRPKLTGFIFSYFSGLPLEGMEFYSRPGRMFFNWYTNEGMTLAGMACRYEDFQRLGADPDKTIADELQRQVPEFAQRVRAAKREEPWRKYAVRNFCRVPFGPGWALVGDAGMTMDPITAAGITNGFRDAGYLAEALHDALSGEKTFAAALARYEEQRNAASVPIYEFTCEMAKLDPPPQQFIDLLEALRCDQTALNEYFGVFAQTVPVQTFFAPDHLARLVS